MSKVSNIFYDSEFFQPEGAFGIIPISYGLVNENGDDRYYAINAEIPESYLLKQQWLRAHVMSNLSPRYSCDWQDMDSIRTGILDFFKRNSAETVQVWAKNGAYDNTVLCMTFGSMGRLFDVMKSIGIRNFEFRDMHELSRAFKNTEIAPIGEKAHLSLVDADYDRYRFVQMRQQHEGFDSVAAPKAF